VSAFSNLPLVIEPADLATRLDAPELILVDLTSAARYAEGHLPGARFVDPKQTQLGRPPAPGLLPEQAQLERVFGALGHRPDAVYVVYDDEGGGWAGRFIWLLDVIGHRHYHYLNGGLHAWLDEARPLSREIPEAATGTPHLVVDDAPTATRHYIESRLGADDLVIWDARSPAEYRGEARALRIREDIAERLLALGIVPDKEIVTHCQTHHRSGFTYLLAKALGYPRVKGYAGSWAEWGNLPDTPVQQ